MPHSEEQQTELERALGYTFQNRKLLQTALTHTSFVKGDRQKQQHNERMEFLGDAVLELCVSEHLYLRNPEMQEGELTKTRARLVCEQALFQAACRLGVPPELCLGHGEELTGGREKPSVVSDALEAIIGAVFLDGGIEKAKALVVERILRLLEDAAVDATDRDYKTRLQEYVQKDHRGELRYETAAEDGPEHRKMFTIRVLLSGAEIGTGEGTSKLIAGQNAAKCALERLKQEH